MVKETYDSVLFMSHLLCETANEDMLYLFNCIRYERIAMFGLH